MNFIIKNIIISILVGSLAYIIFGVATGNGLSAPTDSHQIMALATYLLAVFVGCTVTSAWGTDNLESASAPRSSASRSGSSYTEAPISKESGAVKWFNIKKGYGFITRDQGDDIFVHYRNIEGSGRKALSEGQRVSFLVIDGDKGLQADEVEPI